MAFGSKDLRFRNDSLNGVLIQAIAKPGSIRITMWGTKGYDKIKVKRDKFHSEYQATDRISCVGG